MKKEVIGIIILAVICSLLFFKKAEGNNNVEKNTSDYYHMLEDRYVMVVRDALSEEGYANAGITVNSIIKALDEREYHVYIHHDGITKLEGYEKDQLMEKLARIEFTDKQCSVTYSFVK